MGLLSMRGEARKVSRTAPLEETFPRPLSLQDGRQAPALFTSRLRALGDSRLPRREIRQSPDLRRFPATEAGEDIHPDDVRHRYGRAAA